MYKCVDFRRLLISPEIGFRALVLPERMQFRNKEPPSCDEDAISFGKDKREIAYMLEHQVAGDQIHRPLFAGPPLRQVCHDKADITGAQFLSGLLDHSLSKIEREDPFPNLSQQRSVLARSAPNFQDGFAAQISQDISGNG
jgi:hypothetical protein